MRRQVVAVDRRGAIHRARPHHIAPAPPAHAESWGRPRIDSRAELRPAPCYTVRRMPSLPPAAAAPVLFVAREPDETLRTFLPVIDRLATSHGLDSRVLFHHDPGPWARRELARRAVGASRVQVPNLHPSSPASRRSGVIRTAEEIAGLLLARRLARAALARERPSAVVVIQDTLLLERFLVREANRRGMPTLVIQWAFNFPQAMYDRLRAIQRGAAPTPVARRVSPRRLTAPLTRAAYRATLGALGLSFDLANSYGGGEARLFAVMGEAFKEQFLAQGVRDKRILVTGHPTHDAAYARATTLDAAARAAIRARYRLPANRGLVLYATQPVLWRRVLTPEQLRASVRAIAQAVATLPGPPALILKLHPRERP